MSCQFCNSPSAVGAGCQFSSAISRSGHKVHVHLDHAGCIYCNASPSVVGTGCPFSPSGVHQRGVGTVQHQNTEPIEEDDDELTPSQRRLRMRDLEQEQYVHRAPVKIKNPGAFHIRSDHWAEDVAEYYRRFPLK